MSVYLAGVPLLVLGCALVYAIYQRPQRGLLVLAAGTPFQGLIVLLPAIPYLAGWKEAVVLFTLLATFISPTRQRSRGIVIPWWPALLILVIFGVISGLVAYGLLGLIAVKVSFFYTLLLVILWRSPFTAGDRDRLVSVVLTVAVINAVYGLVQQAVGPDRLVGWGYRYNQEVRTASGNILRSFGTFNQPFPYAFFLMMAILLVGAVSLSDPSRRRSRIYFAVLPLLLAGMAVSVVRASYIGLFFGVVVLGILAHRWILRVVAVAAVLAIPLILAIVPASTVSTILSGASFRTRAGGWEYAINTILTHPLGSGLGSSGAAAAKLVFSELQVPPNVAVRIDGAVAFAIGVPYQPDNYYVKMLIEFGPIGLWLFAIILVSAIATTAYIGRHAALRFDSGFALGVSVTVVAAVVASFAATYFEIFPMDVFFWLLLGACGSIPMVKKSVPHRMLSKAAT